MDEPSRALAQLGIATRDYHAGADEGWLRLLRHDVVVGDYLRQLALAYGFEAPLDAAFAYTPGFKLRLDLRARSRAGLLAQDMLALGIRPADLALLPQCNTIAPFGGPIEALGWMYVVERATLLHDEVRANVRARIPAATSACSYLSTYDGRAGARWNELGRVIDRAAPTRRLEVELVHAARAAFRQLIDWSAGKRLQLAAGA